MGGFTLPLSFLLNIAHFIIGSGVVDEAEFFNLVRAVVPTAKRDVVSELFKEFDNDHSGAISYFEFRLGTRTPFATISTAASIQVAQRG